jgi:hypothetical protein
MRRTRGLPVVRQNRPQVLVVLLARERLPQYRSRTALTLVRAPLPRLLHRRARFERRTPIQSMAN